MPTVDPPLFPPESPFPKRSTFARIFAVVGVGLLLSAAVYVLFNTQVGRQLRTDPNLLSVRVQALEVCYPILTVAGYLAVYYLTSLALLPVWWLQLLAGMAFGLYEGSALSLAGATAGACSAAVLSRWIGGDWLHDRVESRLAKLKSIDDALGHNGLLVVFAVRLVHLLPFGICNYALGLTRISMRDIFIGTFLGSVPAIAMYVGVGAGYHPWRNFPFLAIVGGLNVLLLVPVGLRYWSPKRAG